MLAYTKFGSGNSNFGTTLYNGTHQYKWSTSLIHQHWHHFAFVYTAEREFLLYTDGYLQNPVAPQPNNRGPSNLEMGCHGTKHCTTAKYDDFRVWSEAKDKNFIWRLWLM